MMATSAQAQNATAIIEGKVSDGATTRALEAVSVFIDQTRLGALTNAQGTYRIVGVPVTGGSRTVLVRVRALGYTPASKSVSLTAGQTARADFTLSTSAIQLNQVVVTGSGQKTETKRLGNTVAVIAPPANAPVADISNLLTAREPGLVGVLGGGLAGQGASIRIRGNSSLSQSNEPIIFIDGVRMNNGASGGGGGGGATTRLDDIDPNTIERVEVLKGAAAATLYGTEASNGVIQIFTKVGSQGAPRWSFNAEQSAMRFPDRVAANTGFARTQGQADSLTAFYGRTIRPFETISTNVFRDNLTETGMGTTVGANVTGGGNAVTYFASGRVYSEDGPFGGKQLGVASDEIRRIQTSANLTLTPFKNFRMRFNNNYYNIAQKSPETNNNIYGVNSLAYMARPERANCNASANVGDGTCTGPGNMFGNQAFMTVRESMGQINETAVSRYVGSLDMSYNQTTNLTYSATLGYDYTAGRDIGFSRFGYNVDLFTSQTVTGARSVFNDNTRVGTLDAKVAYNRNFGSSWSTATVGGVQVFNTNQKTTSANSQAFPGPGIEVVGAGGTAITNGESLLTTINGGYFGQSQIGWNDWIFGTVGGRYDFSSAFGENSPGVFYPKASLSIVPSDRKSWSSTRLSTLRFRAAWGQSGRQPGAFDKFTTFQPLTSEFGAGLAPQNLGSEDLKPEISTEIEGGFEAGFFDNRLAFEFTAWDRKVRDALVSRQFPTSGGFRNTQLTNIGEISANGLELNVRFFPIRTATSALELFANAAYLKQTLTSLGGAPPIKVGYFRYRGFLKEGDPLGSLYEPLLATACPAGGPATNSANKPIACYNPATEAPINFNGRGTAATQAELLAYFATPRDLLNSGVQSTLQPLLADYQGTGILFEQRNGDVFPDWTGALGGSYRFRKNWKVQTLFEYRTGFQVQNLTDGFRLSQHPSIGSNRAEFTAIHSTLLNPASTPEQRLAAAQLYVTKYRRLLEPGLNQGQDGTFLRLRELAMTYDVSPTLASKLGARTMSITASGRNLLIWTKYPGVDPEVNAIDRSASTLDQNFLTSTEAFGVPVYRRFAFSVNFGF
ncbi:MAG: SusC/RagA family TonB-linked outer membrane protein [Gemmatimonadaceae bacterium]|nr:SusC/RagA family TonB-linked outer membrane protein [Gemmatimonadaceae bacterium]